MICKFYLWSTCLCFLYSHSSFTETADKDYEMFQKQRDRDMKNILIEHIKTQLKLCKLVSKVVTSKVLYSVGETLSYITTLSRFEIVEFCSIFGHAYKVVL